MSDSYEYTITHLTNTSGNMENLRARINSWLSASPGGDGQVCWGVTDANVTSFKPSLDFACQFRVEMCRVVFHTNDFALIAVAFRDREGRRSWAEDNPAASAIS